MSKMRDHAILFSELISLMARLRGRGGCPWDKRQSHATLVPYLFSEAKEVRAAIKKNDWKNLEEELGDILLQVVFHSRIAEEEGRFGIAGVIDGLNQKLRRRHPHVFGGKKLKTARAVVLQWNKIKELEKKSKK